MAGGGPESHIGPFSKALNIIPTFTSFTHNINILSGTWRTNKVKKDHFELMVCVCVYS